jgi:hypothetical protein
LRSFLREIPPEFLQSTDEEAKKPMVLEAVKSFNAMRAAAS